MLPADRRVAPIIPAGLESFGIYYHRTDAEILSKDGGDIGIEDLTRWPTDCNAFRFLEMAESATTVDGLFLVSTTRSSDSTI